MISSLWQATAATAPAAPAASPRERRAAKRGREQGEGADDGEGGEDLEEEDLRGQLSEVLPMVEKLGQAPTGPWAKGGAR